MNFIIWAAVAIISIGLCSLYLFVWVMLFDYFNRFRRAGAYYEAAFTLVALVLWSGFALLKIGTIFE